jgi:DNA-binding transcriptional ArsR family regulator
MLVVRLDAASVARVRLAPSPALEITLWLHLAASGRRHPLFGAPDAGARFALRDPDVALAAAVLVGNQGYLPDLYTPPSPPARADRLVDEQFAMIRETAAADAAFQVLDERYRGQRPPRAVADAVDRGTFAARVAVGMRRFWTVAMADQWSRLADVISSDIAHRTDLMARRGVGALLGSLHHQMRWTGSRVEIDKPYAHDIDLVDTDLVLTPSALSWPKLYAQVCDPRTATVLYPATGRSPRRERAAPPLDALIGTTRAAILRDLDVPRGTTELSERHGLAKSTVSHHLAVLLHAGLVSRTGTGTVVRYRRTKDTPAA